MANTCMFSMQVAGTHENIDELLRRINGKSSDSSRNLRRFEEVQEEPDIDRISIDAQGTEIARFSGGCAWSVKESGYRPENGFLAISKELNLIIETYGEEIGLEFQEHEIVAFGKIIRDEEVDFEEHDILDVIISEKLKESSNDDDCSSETLKTTLANQKELYKEYSLKPVKELIAVYNDITGNDIVYNSDTMCWEEDRLLINGFKEWKMMTNKEITDLISTNTRD